MDVASLKKKICVTVFLDELFEVIDEPIKKFHVQRSIPTVSSRRRESASKTSFSRKFSDPLEGKLKSWSENYFLPKEKIEKKIKKPRGRKPKLPASVKKELDKLESKLKEKLENENYSKLEINKTSDSFDDEWSKECNDAKVSDGEASDNFSEFYESDLEPENRLRSDRSTQLESPVFEIKKIVEVTKLMESREIIQKVESVEKAEMIKIDEVPRLNEEDILRHSLCSKEIKKSFEELFRRKDSAFGKSLMSLKNESVLFGGSEKSLDCPSKTLRSIVQDTNDLQFIPGNQEKILCYAVQVEMATFEKIAREEIRIPNCLIEDLKNSERKKSVVPGDGLCNEMNENELQTNDEGSEVGNSAIPVERRDEGTGNQIPTNDVLSEVQSGAILDEVHDNEVQINDGSNEAQSNDRDSKILKIEAVINDILIPEKIIKAEIGIVNVLEFKQVANFAYEGLSPLPKLFEKEEIVIEKKTSKENLPIVPKSNLVDDEISTILCTLTLEDLCDEDDIRIICKLDSLIPDA